jgi:hypothetical protein
VKTNEPSEPERARWCGPIRKRTEHAVTHGMASSEQGQQRIARLELRELDDVIHVT